MDDNHLTDTRQIDATLCGSIRPDFLAVQPNADAIPSSACGILHDLRAALLVDLIRLREDEAPPHLQALLRRILKAVLEAIADPRQ